jgi:hypothetical protein
MQSLTIASIQALQHKTTSVGSAELHRACSAVRENERLCQLQMIIHLAEVNRRKLHLDLGYMYLSDYCQRTLGLSEGEAWSRVQIAKASFEFPELLLAIAEGRLSLTVAGMLVRHLKHENKHDLMQRCEGKSKRWVERFLVAISGLVTNPQSSLRPLLVPKPPQPQAHQLQQKQNQDQESEAFSASFMDQNSDGFSLQSVHCKVHSQLVHQLRCTISEEIKADLLRLAEVLGIANPEGNLEALIGKSAKIALQAKDPALRVKKQTKQKGVKPAGCSGDTATDEIKADEIKADEIKIELNPMPKQDATRSRYIALTIKRQILERAGYQCQFFSIEGKRCCQRTGLQIDHIHAFSWGGGNNQENLQVLCSLHNRRKYERECSKSDYTKQSWASR